MKALFSIKASALFVVLCLLPQGAFALAKGDFVNPVTETAWEEILPIRLAGITLMSGGSYDTPDIARGFYCTCPAPPPLYIRYGLPLSFWQPHRTVSAVKDPYWFPEFGTEIELKFLKGDLAGTSQQAVEGASVHYTFLQAHWVFYPIWSIIGMTMDSSCVSQGGVDVFYMSEVDVMWQDDSLSVLIQPEVILFRNPIAQLACVADAIAVNLWRPLEVLFWCMGSGGSAYPLTGRVGDGAIIQAASSITHKLTYKLSRQMMLKDKALSLCMDVTSPFWVKPHYKYQMQRPVVKQKAYPVGKSALLYEFLANPTTGTSVGSAENFSYLFFQKTACCSSY